MGCLTLTDCARFTIPHVLHRSGDAKNSESVFHLTQQKKKQKYKQKKSFQFFFTINTTVSRSYFPTVMDLEDFRSILKTAGVDVWTFIDTAILVASLDYATELKERRDKIVERLYATCIASRCRNCDFGNGVVDVNKEISRGQHDEVKAAQQASPSTPHSVNGDDDIDIENDNDIIDPYGGLFDDEQKRILEIKEHLEDPDQVLFFFFISLKFVFLSIFCVWFQVFVHGCNLVL